MNQIYLNILIRDNSINWKQDAVQELDKNIEKVWLGPKSIPGLSQHTHWWPLVQCMCFTILGMGLIPLYIFSIFSHRYIKFSWFHCAELKTFMSRCCDNLEILMKTIFINIEKPRDIFFSYRYIKTKKHTSSSKIYNALLIMISYIAWLYIMRIWVKQKKLTVAIKFVHH